MKTESVAKLKVQIDEIGPKLSQLTDAEMHRLLGAGLWSGKEILGHLVDSTTMNRQRIVRSQYEELDKFPSYVQDKWVQIQSYSNYSWADLVRLYLAEYQHLVHVLEHLPDERANDQCPVRFADSDFVTIEWLVGHIYRHNDHHLQQILWLVGQSDLPDTRELSQPIKDLPKRK